MLRNQNREVIQLILFIVIATSFIVGVLQLLVEINKRDTLVGDCPSHSPSVVSSEPPLATTPTLLQDLISFGEKPLVEKEDIRTEDLNLKAENPKFKAEKEKGAKAFSAGDYKQAAIHFQHARNLHPNAPENLIFLNNAQIGQAEIYTIAVVAPIGSDRDVALEILRGVGQAQNEINSSGGLKGVRLKVAIANDNNQIDYAKQIATALVNKPEVLGVVGHFASGVTLAAGSVYKSGELVAISPTSTAVELSNFSSYLFRTSPSDKDAAANLAKYILPKLQRKKAAVFFSCQSTYSKSLTNEFDNVVKSKGVSVLHIKSDLSDPSFNATQSVKQAIKLGAEVLMLAPSSDVLDKALEVVGVNQKRLTLMGGDDVYGCKVLRKGEEAAEGMVVAVPWHIEGNRQSNFVRNSQVLWGKVDVNWRTALAYDATQALAAAIERSPKRKDIQPTLLSDSFSPKGASGPIKFLRTGDRRNPPVQLVKISLAKPSCRNSSYNFVPIYSNTTGSVAKTF